MQCRTARGQQSRVDSSPMPRGSLRNSQCGCGPHASVAIPVFPSCLNPLIQPDRPEVPVESYQARVLPRDAAADVKLGTRGGIAERVELIAGEKAEVLPQSTPDSYARIPVLIRFRRYSGRCLCDAAIAYISCVDIGLPHGGY